MKDKIIKNNQKRRHYYFKKIGIYFLSFVGLLVMLAIPTSIIRSISFSDNISLKNEVTEITSEKEEVEKIN